MDATVELRHLRCLVAIAEEGTFTDAAIRLGVTQPVVSRTLAQLESLVGSRLVERTTRELHLSATGEACYREAVVALAAVNAAIRAGGGLARPLRLGFSWAALGQYTTDVLRDWRASRPDVPLEVHRFDDRSAGLSRGLVDVAVIRGAVDDPAVQTTLLMIEPRLASLPSGHRLAGRSSVAIDELAADPVALTPASGTTTPDLWAVDHRPGAFLSVDNIDEWLTLISSGAAVGVTAASTAFQHPHHGLVYVPLTGAPPVEVHLAWPRVRAHPAVGEFAALVRRHVGARSGSPQAKTPGPTVPGPATMRESNDPEH